MLVLGNIPVQTVAVSGYNVRIRRRRLRLGQVELAELAGVNKNTITAIEDGRGSTRTITQVLVALEQQERERGLAPLADGAIDDEAEPTDADVSDYTPDDIPVIYEGEASPQGTLFWDNEGKLKSDIERRISRPRDITDPKAYGVLVRGDSMVPRYMPGETLIVSPNAVVKSGTFAYVELLSGERLIKRVHRQPGGWNLESLNAAYAPRFVPQSDVGVIHKIMYGRSL